RPNLLIPSMPWSRPCSPTRTRPSWQPRSHGVTRPDGANRLLVAESVRDGRAGFVGVIPPLAVQRRPHRPAAGHLQVAVAVRRADPLPGVLEPVGPVLLPLVSE